MICSQPQPVTLITRVLIVDDHPRLREVLRRTIEKVTPLTVVGEGSNGEEAVELAQKLHPEVIVLDYSMPKLNGAQAARLIAQWNPEIRIIGFSLRDDCMAADEMLQAGAAAFFSKDDPRPLLEFLAAIADGQIPDR